MLQGPALRGLARTLPAGRARSGATASAWVFAVAGVLTHQCCASLVLAHQRAVATAGLTAVPPRVPRTLTTLLAASAAGSLAALAGSSAATTVAGPGSLGDRTRRAAGTPFPWVLAALLTSSALPAPVGGYVRPASISSGLLASFALTALAARRVRPVGR